MVALVTVVTLGAGTIGMRAVSARSTPGHVAIEENLAEAIATHFHLDAAEVKQVLEEEMTKHRQELDADRATFFSSMLDKHVEEGDLTRAQADALQAKMQSLPDFQKDMEGKTREERHAAMAARRAELETWAQEQGIPLAAILGPVPDGKERRFFHPRGRGMMHHGNGRLGTFPATP